MLNKNGWRVVEKRADAFQRAPRRQDMLVFNHLGERPERGMIEITQPIDISYTIINTMPEVIFTP